MHHAAPPVRARRWAASAVAALALGLCAAAPVWAHPQHHGGAERAERGAAMSGMPGVHGMPGGGWGMMFNPRALDSVGATAEQKAQLGQIMASARSDIRALHDAHSGLREQIRNLMTQPQVDARAAETLRQQMLAQHDQVSRRMLQAALEASRVLTVEQRQQLAARAEQMHQQRQQRHEQMRQRMQERHPAAGPT
jgi:Spy/CpxP family protein refolding chaperone